MSNVDEDNLLFTQEYKWQFYEIGKRTVPDNTLCPHKYPWFQMLSS